MTSRKQPPGETGGRLRSTTASVSGAQRAVPLPAGRRLRDDFPVAVQDGLSIPFKGTVGGTPEAARINANKLQEAIALLSHSPTGRQLLQDLARSGYSVCFDDKKTREQGAIGLCDSETKQLIMRSFSDSEELALYLAHEAVHALQNERADDLLPSTHHKPETVFRLSFAIEADAYAQQVQIAFELARGAANRQRPLLMMRGRLPDMVRAGERIMATAAKTDRDNGAAALGDGRVMAGLFNAFYDSTELRRFYEDSHLKWINDYAKRHAKKSAGQKGKAASAFNARAGLADMFRRDVGNARLRRLLTWQGKPYLQTHRPDIDFTQPRYAGLSTVARQGVLDFYTKWLPDRPLPDIATFGLVVASDNPAPDRAPPRAEVSGNRPVKAPRKRKRDFW